MSLPTLSVRVAFASNPYDTSLTWTEIGPFAGAGPGNAGWVRKVQTKRGRERLLRTQVGFQAGTATVTLDNRDRRFDPTNTSGPYYPNVQPEKVIQVGAWWSGTFYPIWTGYADDWPQSWPGMSEAETAVPATDLFKSLGLARVLSAGYPKQVLSDGAFSYYRLKDPAGSTFAADSSANANPATLAVGPGASATFGQPGLLSGDPASSLQTAIGGANTYVQINATAAGQLVSASGVSTELRMEGTNNACQVSPLLAFKFGANSYQATFFIVGTTISVGDLNSGVGTVFTPTLNVFDGLPHTITFTITTGWVIKTYIDGALQNTFAGTAFTPAAASFSNILINETGTASMSVNLQEWATYPTALSAAQVANHQYLSAFSAQTTDGYIAQLATWLGFPARLLNLQTGYTKCQADSQDETQTKVIDLMQKIEQTEQGQLFIGADGTLNFKNRYSRYISPNLNSTATLGDGGNAFPTEIPYAIGGVTLNFDRAELYNDMAVTRRNGNLQEATSPTSITAFGNRAPAGLSDLLMATDVDALYCAQWIVADTAFPQYRIGTLVIDPRVDDRWWPILLGAEIGTVLTVNKHNIPGTGPSMSLHVRVEGIEHQIEPPKGWLTIMHVSLSGTLPWLILDDPVTGLLDSGNRLGW